MDFFPFQPPPGMLGFRKYLLPVAILAGVLGRPEAIRQTTIRASGLHFFPLLFLSPVIHTAKVKPNRKNTLLPKSRK